MQAQHAEIEALQRSVTVFEILGNLHCYSEQMDPRLQGRFAALLCTEILRRDARGEDNLFLPSSITLDLSSLRAVLNVRTTRIPGMPSL